MLTSILCDVGALICQRVGFWWVSLSASCQELSRSQRWTLTAVMTDMTTDVKRWARFSESVLQTVNVIWVCNVRIRWGIALFEKLNLLVVYHIAQISCFYLGLRWQLSLLCIAVQCVSKKDPTLKWYGLKLHGSILMIFGRNIQKTLE